MKLTYEDYLSIPEDGRRHEFIDGEYYVSGSPNFRHQLVITELLSELVNHCHAHSLGWAVSYVCTVLSEHSIVLPDVVFISNERRSIISDVLRGSPDLIIEVLGPNRDYDERIKFNEYEQRGVDEYWIADPDAESIKIFRRTGNKFAPVPVADVITTPLLPGFQLRIADLFA